MPIAGLTSNSTKETQTGNRMPIAGLTSDSKQRIANRKPTANRWAYVRLHTNRKTWKPNANHWTYIRLRTNKRTQETNCQSLDLHRTPTRKGETTHTNKIKGRLERSTHLLPTYLIWYEDQGDVVPLNRGETFS